MSCDDSNGLRHAWTAALAASVLLAGMSGCGADDSRPTLHRLIEHEPAQLFSEARFVTEALLAEIPQAATATWELQDWDGRFTPLEETPVRPDGEGGLRMRSPHSRYWLAGTLPEGAAAATTARIGVDGLVADDLLTLCWSVEPRRFEPDACAHASTSRSGGREIELRLPGSAGWAAARHFKLQLTTAAERTLTFRSIAFFGTVRMRDARERVAATPWKATLDGITRDGWVTLPGERIERSLTVPDRGGVLLLAYGATPGTSGDVEAEVAIVSRGERRVMVSAPITSPDAWAEVELPLAAYAGEAVTLQLGSRVGETAAERGFVAWGGPRLQEAPRRGPRPPSVLVISLDTLRSDRLSLHGYERPTTPHLDRWAGRSAVVFRRARTSAPWTLPSHVSMLSGLLPFRHGVVRSGPIPGAIPLLAEAFRAAGYTTRASTVGPALTAGYRFDQGFDVFDERATLLDIPGAENELAEGIDDLIGFLERQGDRPFLYFFHTYEAHAPLRARGPYFSRFGGDRAALDGLRYVTSEPEDLEPGRQARFRWVRVSRDPGNDPAHQTTVDDRRLLDLLYDSGVAQLDAELGRLFDFLEESGLGSEMIVVVTSDHGESLLDEGRVGHTDLQEEVLAVPLLIAAPGLGLAPRRVDALVQTVDIVPTLLDLAGLEQDESLDGASLRRLMAGEPAPSRAAWAYAPHNNRGILFEDPTGFRYRWFDTVWYPARGREQLLASTGDAVRERARAPSGEELAALRAQMVELLDDNLPALRIEFANPTSEAVRFVITSERQGGAITSLDLDFDCCTLIDAGVEVRVPGHARFTLLLQDRSSGSFSVLAEDAAGTRFAHQIPDLTSFRGPASMFLERSGWMVAEAPAPENRPGWTAWRTGPPLGAGASDLTDQESLRHLRALGYVR